MIIRYFIHLYYMHFISLEYLKGICKQNSTLKMDIHKKTVDKATLRHSYILFLIGQHTIHLH